MIRSPSDAHLCLLLTDLDETSPVPVAVEVFPVLFRPLCFNKNLIDIWQINKRKSNFIAYILGIYTDVENSKDSQAP